MHNFAHRLALLIFIQFVFVSTLLAQKVDVYQCQDGERRVYSQTPCSTKDNKTIHLNVPQPSKEAQKQAQSTHRARLKEAKKLQKARDKQTAKDLHQYEQALKQKAAANKQCEALQLKVTWAKEDLMRSQARHEMQAQIKLKRAQQKAALACQGL